MWATATLHLIMDLLMSAIANSLIFALGASIGSFLNVVIYRLPAQLSLLYPPSRCPQCLHTLGKKENIPVVGWIALKGRCRWCKTPISPRYPLIEALTGWFFLVVFWHFGFELTTPGYWLFISWLIALSFIDLDTMTLPNILTQSGLVLGLIFQGLQGWNNGQIAGLSQQLMTGIIGAVVGIWLLDGIGFFGAVWLKKTAMGAGDSKLAAMLGAWLGLKLMLVSGFLACAIGALIGGGGILIGILKRQQQIPFGPFLALGAIISLFYGNALIEAYLNLFFPNF
jgi:leader peptidase (prepilin peptidase) / N-methyltransferase